MKNRPLLLFTFFLFLMPAFTALAHDNHQHTKAEKAVLKTFAAYRSALTKQNGKKAVKHIAQNTIDYYAQMLEHARNADSATVAGLNVMDKLLVLSFRNRVDKNRLLTMSPIQSVQYAIDKGMVGKEGLANLELGDISIKDNVAKAQVLINHRPAPLEFVFYKEKKRWKIDLTAFFPMAEMAISQTAKELEMTETELVEFMLKLVEPNTLNPKLWLPVAKW